MPIKPPYSLLTLKQLNQIRAHIITTPIPQHLNSIIKSLALSNTPQDALLLFDEMLHRSTSHNHFTYTHILKACSLLDHNAMEMGHQIHARTIKSGHYSSDVFIQNSLIHLYTKFNDILSARCVFDEIPDPDIVSWTSLISGLCKSCFEEEALIAFRSMDVRPNTVTLVTILSACSQLRALRIGKSIHAYYMRNFCGDNILIDNALLFLYTSCGSSISASTLFETMRKRDVVTWTTMLGGYAQRGCCEDAFGIFQEMIRRGEAIPNEATFVNILWVCSSQGALSLGRWVHAYMDRTGVIANGNVGNALVDMYAKCGDMGMAVKVFKGMKCKDLVSWSIVIGGMALNGHGEKALELFSLMICHGAVPDGVTFVGLLSACSHAGLVDRGLIFFRAMESIYGVIPEMEHYACMVDMYGRAGLLSEAEDFIRDMPLEPDGRVWGSLVNSCKLHGDEKTTENVRECILSRKSGITGGTFALLSNTYSDFERWNDANDVRDTMRSMGLKKIRGCSWVEVDT